MMTPITQGPYEFKKESLVEIRKRLGLSQREMSDLLGVPANTLSRWETGATVPDAVSLAAIYSLAKEKGMEPLFFEIRKSPLQFKIGSKALDQPSDILALFESCRNYLSTQIELIGTELAPVIKVRIRNMAPDTPDWPRIVFTGVGLSLAHIGGDTSTLRPSKLKTRTNRTEKEEAPAITATPWQHDSKIESLLKIEYSRIGHQPSLLIEPGVAEHGEVLFPGQCVIYEMDVPPEALPYLQFRVEGTVSHRQLFHCEDTFTMPETFTKPLALSGFVDLNAIDLYGPLESVIGSMPKFDSDTRLAEVQAFSTVLSDTMTKVKVTQEHLNNVFRQHKFPWFRAHLRAAFIFLDRLNAALTRMKEAIESKSTDKIAAEASAILALRGEAAQLKDETQELMRRYNISDEEIRRHGEEVKRQKEEQLKAAMEAATKSEARSQPVVVQEMPDELDLHGMSVKEAIPAVNEYLEDCYNAKMRQVWIVHGKGEGILRQFVEEQLRIHKLVNSFRLADSNRGGEGATQVELID